MWVCLTFAFFSMLHQSNLASSTPAQFDASKHTCRGHIIQALPRLFLVVHWTKTHQSISSALVLLILEVPDHPADPVDAFRQLLSASPSSNSDHSLLTYITDGCVITVLASALFTVFNALRLDLALYSLQSLVGGGGVMAAYRHRLAQVNIKKHGLWASDYLGDYTTAPCV